MACSKGRQRETRAEEHKQNTQPNPMQSRRFWLIDGVPSRSIIDSPPMGRYRKKARVMGKYFLAEKSVAFKRSQSAQDDSRHDGKADRRAFIDGVVSSMPVTLNGQ
jgi:hypothetical protein